MHSQGESNFVTVTQMFINCLFSMRYSDIAIDKCELRAAVIAPQPRAPAEGASTPASAKTTKAALAGDPGLRSTPVFVAGDL